MPLMESKYRKKRKNDEFYFIHRDTHISYKNASDIQQEARNSRLRLKIRLLQENEHFKTSTYVKYISHINRL